MLEDPYWHEEQTMLWCISAYAEHLNRHLEWWEIDGILAVADDTSE